MHGLVALDAAGEVIRPAILWNDGRTAAECAEIEEKVGLERLIALTGNRALTGFTAPKLLWLRKHEPEAYGRIARIMLPKDYVRWKLCGEHAIDMADASGTLLLDVAGRRWSDEVLDALEIDRGVAAAAARVARGLGHDAGGRAGRRGRRRPGRGGARRRRRPAGAALRRARDLRASSSPRCPPSPPTSRRASTRSATPCPGGWHAMGVMLSAAGSLAWLRDTAAPGEDVRRAGRGGRGAWEPGVEGLTFLPYLAGERTPHADPRRARLVHRPEPAPRPRRARARRVLEGVAYGLRDSLDLLVELGVRPERGRVSGGGARSELWLRIIASVLEIPLERPVVEEGAAYGAALLGGVAGGTWASTDEAVAACVQVTGEVEPEPAWIEPYAEGRARFRALYPALRDV